METLPWRNLNLFSKKVFDLRKNQFLKSKEKLCFFDRGIVDTYIQRLAIQKFQVILKNQLKHLDITRKYFTPQYGKKYTLKTKKEENLQNSKKIEENLIELLIIQLSTDKNTNWKY